MSKKRSRGLKEKDPIDGKLNELIFTALGEASVCWYPKPKGTFRPDEATRVGNRLREDIKKLVIF